MSKRTITLVALAAFAVSPNPARAQATLGPTLAFHDTFDFGIGAGIQAPMTGASERVSLLGEFLIFFPGGGANYFEINGGVTYDFPLTNATVLPFALGGLSLSRWSAGSGVGASNSTDLHLNLGGGIKFDAGSFRPSAGARVEVGNGDAFVLFATLPFAVGN